MPPITKPYMDRKYECLLVTVPKPRILLIELNRPKALNAFNKVLHRELKQAFDDYAVDDELFVAIVTATGTKAFCAGQDLVDVKDAGGLEDLPGGLGGITHKKPTLMKPIIAAVNGLALGGGMELAIACDIIIASEKASFGLPEVKVGLAALGGGAQNLSKLIGYQRAMYYAMQGIPMTAQQALAMGIAQEVVPADKLVERAIQIAEVIANNSPDGVRATKAMARAGLEMGWIETNMITNDLPEVKAMWRSENMREGVTAFSEKRRPSWKPYAKI
ncbi:putative enoyl CoA hydratase [Hyaloraphidium curvatum]|nr:putative enoyl CoA hydratase [Hyaloraphidium curvatum]